MSTRGEVLLQLMNKLIFLGLIPVLMLTAQNVYACGVRGDTPDGATPDEVDCLICSIGVSLLTLISVIS
jgi:uncharacterized membrane protein